MTMEVAHKIQQRGGIVGCQNRICLSVLNETISDKCMHCAATLLGQYYFIELAHPTQEYWCPFENFKNRFHDVFVKELIELSALARASLDVADEFSSKPSVGSLTQNNTKSELSVREACNKIIHAKTLNVDFGWLDKHPLDNGRNGYGDSSVKKFKNPIIITTGKYKKNKWQADISFLKYIDELQAIFSM